MVTLHGVRADSLAYYRRAKKRINNVVNIAQIDAKKPQVKLGWSRKVKCTKKERRQIGEKYKLVEATMSEKALQSIPKVAKGTLLGTMILGFLGFTKGKFEEIKYIEKLPQIIAQNIEKARILSAKEDSLIADDILPYPAKFAHIAKDSASAGFRFYNSLKKNKDSLMKDLCIDNDTYDRCARVAMKIAHNESQLGTSTKFRFFDKLESYDFMLNIGSNIRKAFRGDGTLSLGMTQFKISKASENEKELFKKYGITFEKNRSNILEPEKSAIATLIHLVEISKDYPTYLENVRTLHPNVKRRGIKKSIQNAKQILFNDDKRPDALKALIGKLYAKDTVITHMTSGTEFADVTAKDLEDLKIYASTVELSHDAYLAARWNGKKIIPSGIDTNYACKNLLNIIAQKGYISNVDKSSKVIY